MNLKSRLAILIVSLAILITAIIFFVIVPLANSINNIGMSIRTERLKVASDNGRILKARQFKEFVKNEEANFKKTQSVLLDSKIPANFLDFVHYLKSSSSDANVSVEFSPSVSQSGSETIGIGMVVDGDINSTMLFVKKMETGQYLTEIKNFSLNKKANIKKLGDEENQIGQENKVTANIFLEVYIK
jgi:hypothetical protein